MPHERKQVVIQFLNILFKTRLLSQFYQIHQTIMSMTTFVKNMILLCTTILVNHIYVTVLKRIGSYFAQTCEEYDLGE